MEKNFYVDSSKSSIPAKFSILPMKGQLMGTYTIDVFYIFMVRFSFFQTGSLPISGSSPIIGLWRRWIRGLGLEGNRQTTTQSRCIRYRFLCVFMCKSVYFRPKMYASPSCPWGLVMTWLEFVAGARPSRTMCISSIFWKNTKSDLPDFWIGSNCLIDTYTLLYMPLCATATSC